MYVRNWRLANRHELHELFESKISIEFKLSMQMIRSEQAELIKNLNGITEIWKNYLHADNSVPLNNSVQTRKERNASRTTKSDTIPEAENITVRKRDYRWSHKLGEIQDMVHRLRNKYMTDRLVSLTINIHIQERIPIGM